MAVALAIIVLGGIAILARLHLVMIAAGFWLAFAAATGMLALSGHAMTARWHLGEITGFYFWRVLITSPEILVFLFFMITDPKTSPKGTRARVVYSVSIALLATLLIAGARTEYWSKVAVLGALALVCVARALYRRFAPEIALGRRWILVAVGGVALAYTGAVCRGHPCAPARVALPLPRPASGHHDPPVQGRAGDDRSEGCATRGQGCHGEPERSRPRPAEPRGDLAGVGRAGHDTRRAPPAPGNEDQAPPG